MTGIEVAGLILAGVGAAAGVKSASERSKGSKNQVRSVKLAIES